MGCSESNTKGDQKAPTQSGQNANNGKNTNLKSENNANMEGFEVVFVVGGPGSGKGTQCALIKDHFGFAHLSTGDLLRKEKDSKSQMAETINKIMMEGKLVPTEILITLLKKEMLEIGKTGLKKFLIDGFPRNQENVDVWHKHIGNSINIKFVLFFDVDEETMRGRLLKRGETSGRTDDNEASIIKRFKTFQEESVPIIKSFEQAGKLKTINAGLSKEEVFEKVRMLFVKPDVVFVVGGPGSGKGTQCASIKEHFGYAHLSTGDLLRKEKETGSETAKQIEQIMNDGKLVPTEILIKLLINEMQAIGWDKKFLIDGFPRGQENVDVWHKYVGDTVNLKFVLYFELDEETMRERLLKRGETSGRSDDNEESIIKRFKTFQSESVPIIKQFEQMGKLKKINSKASKEEVFEQVKLLFA